MFLHYTPKNWAFQVHMYAYAHNSQPLPELNVSPHEIVFHTNPRIPLIYDLKLKSVFPDNVRNFQYTFILTKQI